MSADAPICRLLRHCRDVPGKDGVFPTPIDGLTALRLTDTRALMHMVHDPVFCLVLQGAKETASGDARVICGPMQSLVVAVDLPVVSRVTQATAAHPYLALALRLTPALFAEMEAAAGTAGGQAQGMAVGATAPPLLDAVSRMVGLIDTPAARPVLEPLVRREIHYWLLVSDHGPRLLRLLRAAGAAHRIARAAARLRRDFAQTLRVEDLARDAGMSVSAFHDRFRAVTGTSPVQFQKSLRLIEARRLLRAGRHTVATAAFAVGYESPTQFSREYARRFGTPPRADLPRGLALAG
jgi:AraC-like DNA-binding protein